jgi:peptidoglycan/xylan/chitin deacetylase (PgdA/CDA1 family)
MVSLDEVGAHLDSQRLLRKPAAAITFDDGYSDVFHHAYPLLKKKGIPAAIFVVTGLIETARVQVFDRLYLTLRLLERKGLPAAATFAAALRANKFDASEIERLWFCGDVVFALMTRILNTFPQEQIEAALTLLEQCIGMGKEKLAEMMPLTWDMIRKMHRDGITVGSHTVSHRLLPTEAAETVRSELIGSKQTLERETGATVSHFAYPDGRFNLAVIEAVESAGYRFAYGTCRAQDRRFPRLTIPRKVLWQRSCLNVLGRFSPSIMNCQADGLFDRRGHCDHDHCGVAGEV